MQYQGNNTIAGKYIGNTEVLKQYLGENLIWEKPSAVEYTIYYKTVNNAVLTGGTPTIATNGYEIESNVYDSTTGGTMTLSGPSAATPDLSMVFSGRSQLVEVSFGSGIEEIGAQSFRGCNGLISVDFNKVKKLNDWAFGDCTLLTSVTWGDVEYIGDTCFYKGGLRSLDLRGTKVKTLITAAFQECKFTSVILNDDITVVPERCFWMCSSNTAITFGSGLTEIGVSGCAYSYSLHVVTFTGENPPTTNKPITTTSGTIYCPASAVSTYEAWKSSAGNFSG